MIPLRDSIPAQRVPVVRNALVLLCAAAFVLQLGDPEGQLVGKLPVPLKRSSPSIPDLPILSPCAGHASKK